MSSLLSRIGALFLPAARPATEASARRHFAHGDRAQVPSGAAEECRWCGNAHDVSELCRPRRVNRRAFILTASAAAAGALVAPALPAPLPPAYNYSQMMFLAGRRGGKSRALDAFLYGQQWLLTDATTGNWYHALTRDDRRYASE